MRVVLKRRNGERKREVDLQPRLAKYLCKIDRAEAVDESEAPPPRRRRVYKRRDVQPHHSEPEIVQPTVDVEPPKVIESPKVEPVVEQSDAKVQTKRPRRKKGADTGQK